MKPRRVQRKRTKGWRMPEGAVYVGRPTKWGNPFRVQQSSDGWDVVDGDGDVVASAGSRARATQVATILHAKCMEPESYELVRRELARKDLVCWCPLDQPCHADVLLEIANA